MEKIPINDTVIYALARLVDDAQKERRDTSHSDIEFQINKANLTCADPNKEGSRVGKAKRVRAVLMWGIEKRQEAAGFFAYGTAVRLSK